jgi:hypothetical protein
MFGWPGPDAALTMQSERTGIENKWFAVTGRVVELKIDPVMALQLDQQQSRSGEDHVNAYQNHIDIVTRGRQHCVALSSLGASPQEPHLTFFPQG